VWCRCNWNRLASQLDEAEGKCISINLGTESGHDLVWRILEEHCGEIELVALAPPCGTSSRAREKEIPEQLQKNGVPRPRQLRNAAYPFGMPDLHPAEQAKVTSANVLYAFTLEVVHFCQLHNIRWLVENPYRSWMWELPGFRELVSLSCVFQVDFSQCMHCDEGELRDKVTRFLTNVEAFKSLRIRCDKSHVHADW
jgi:hypothetical protein